jgi:hypothetical protein
LGSYARSAFCACVSCSLCCVAAIPNFFLPWLGRGALEACMLFSVAAVETGRFAVLLMAAAAAEEGFGMAEAGSPVAEKPPFLDRPAAAALAADDEVAVCCAAASFLACAASEAPVWRCDWRWEKDCREARTGAMVSWTALRLANFAYWRRPAALDS